MIEHLPTSPARPPLTVFFLALFICLVPGCATFTLQSEDPRYGKIAFAYTLPELRGYSK